MDSKKILEKLSDANLEHMHKKEMIMYFLLHFFRAYDSGPLGITEKQANDMSFFEQIYFLFHIRDEPIFHSKLPLGFISDLRKLLKKIKPRDFKIAPDMKKSVMICQCGRHFVLGKPYDILPQHNSPDGEPCLGSELTGVTEDQFADPGPEAALYTGTCPDCGWKGRIQDCPLLQGSEADEKKIDEQHASIGDTLQALHDDAKSSTKKPKTAIQMNRGFHFLTNTHYKFSRIFI